MSYAKEYWLKKQAERASNRAMLGDIPDRLFVPESEWPEDADDQHNYLLYRYWDLLEETSVRLQFMAAIHREIVRRGGQL